jgi:glutathione S-transferase
MKLYYTNGACSLATRIAIHEMGLSCEFESVDLREKKTEKGNDFFAINSKGSVPALQLNADTVLTEGAVILQYLADSHPESHLLPKVGDLARYRTLEWLNFIATDLHKGCSPFFNPNMPEDIKEKIFKPNLKKALKFLDQHLAKQYYLSDKTLSIADCYLFVILTWIPHLGIPLSEYPSLELYFDRLNERKAFQQALKEEGLVASESANGGACGVTHH